MMNTMELSFMASHGYPPGLVLPQQPIFSTSKEHQQFLPCLKSRQDMLNSCSLYKRPNQVDEDWKPMPQQFKNVQFIEIDKAIRNHILNGVKDTHPNSILLSLGIARQIARRENIIKFLTSNSSEIERAGLDISVLSELMELQALTDMPQEPFVLERPLCSQDVESQPSLIYPVSKNCFQKPLLGIAQNMYHESEFTCERDRQLSFINNATELQGILPNITGFGGPAKRSTNWEMHSLLVPYFERKKSRTTKAGAPESSLNLETMPPLKSADKTKAKQSLKKKINRKSEKETDMYNNNFVRACESLLSIMIDKKREGKTAIQTLKKTGTELPPVLSQFSAGIAGTGIAVLFCVISKVACSSTPFCASQILSTGLGIGLIWLSSAVNRLRDTIICIIISKKSSKADPKEEDNMVKFLDEGIKEIYFRAATLLAIIVLKIA